MPYLIYWHKPDPNKATDWTNWFWTGEGHEDHALATKRATELTEATGWRHELRALAPVHAAENRFPRIHRPPYVSSSENRSRR